MSETRYVVGIDLGTTNTLCAFWREAAPGERTNPEMLPIIQPVYSTRPDGFQRHDLLPSAVAILPEGVFVGHHSKELARQGNPAVVTSIKRYMGTRWARKLGDRDWSPEQISACILRAVRRQIETTFAHPPAKVVITVPACFGTEERRATLRAARLAGFDIQQTRLFDEPAAALFYQIQHDLHTLQEDHPRRLMMIDIGGGTLDVSLLRVQRIGKKLITDIQGRSRYNELAGDDFDLRIAGLLLARFEQERGSLEQQPYDVFRGVCYELLREAEKAKVRLSRAGASAKPDELMKIKETVEVRQTPDRKPWQHPVTLMDMATALKKFFPYSEDEEVRRTDHRIFKPIQQCLDSASHITGRKCRPADVDAVFLAGGSSQLPMINEAVQAIMEQEPRVVDRPMHAVTLGAAWFAGMEEGFGGQEISVLERLFEGLYLQTQGGQFKQLLSPRAQVPLARERHREAWYTSQPDRRVEFALFVGMGEEDANLMPLARRRVDFQELLPQGQPMHLEISVSKNRQVELECSTDLDGRQLRGRLEVSTALGWQDDDHQEEPVPEVNRPVKETQP